ncbi:MAG TPA: cupin domain-containing protein [Gaiellaceae bacterium]
MEGEIVSGPGEGERFVNDRRIALIKAALPDVTVLEFTIESDAYEGPDPHTHADHTDSFYVLEGELDVFVEGETVRVGPGTFVAAPRGVSHGFKVPAGSGRVRFLNIHAPGGFEHDMRRMNS